MSVGRRLLVIELLHADAELYRSASATMKAEGRAMLYAMVQDLSAWPESHVDVGLCEEALRDLNAESVGPKHPNVQWKVASNIDELLEHESKDGPPYEIGFCLAPECDELLSHLTRQLSTCIPRLLSVSQQVIDLCSDKLALCEWCEQNKLPTVSVLNPEDADHWPLSDHDYVVRKDRFGAGCHSIRKFQWSWQNVKHLPELNSEDYVWQPFLTGSFYSVGILAAPQRQQPCILPVAQQQIEWMDGSPVYQGGQIPADLDDDEQAKVGGLIERLLQLLPIKDGYLGVDLIHCPQDSGAEWKIMEINPRLCTSYLGYRHLALGNLASIWWTNPPESVPIDCRKSTRFHIRSL